MIAKLRSRLPSATDTVLVLALLTAGGSTLFALHSAWRWPLVGDASLMRYVVFLLRTGHAPYRQIIDINLPGSYLLEAAAMGVFGSGGTGLRLYDGALSLIVCVCAALLPSNLQARVCALLGGLLLVLVHLHDGLVQAGQRDYAILVIVLMAYVVLLKGPTAHSRRAIALFGALIGLALIVKPTILLMLGLPAYASYLQGRKPREILQTALLTLTAALLPVIAMFGWHAVAAFFSVMKLAATSHHMLAQKTFGFLLVHAVQPVTALFLVCMLLAALTKFAKKDETKLLLFGALAGLCSFLAQGKGFPYQRYPFLGLLLLVMFGSVQEALRSFGMTRVLAASTLAFSSFWLMPHFARDVSSYDAAAPFQQALAHDLTILRAGNDEVQCLDTVGGCINTLYNLRLVQATGYLYDCYAYVGPQPMKDAYRRAFLAQLTTRSPRYIVLSSQFCLGMPEEISRANRWPELEAFLKRNYGIGPSWAPLGPVHWWHQSEVPPGYEIFVRREADNVRAPDSCAALALHV